MAGSEWRDDAITSRRDDAFGRTAYADRAAELIARSHTWDSSTVFGLTGSWGSGKTSLVAMIVESLKESHPDWVIARFTPWAASDVGSLLGEFYSSLTEALPKRKGVNVRKALGKLALVSAPAATVIPYAGESVKQFMTMAGEGLVSSPSWDTSFEEATARLKDLSAPVLVIADDIDRLQSDELWTLLKVVRLLGRFPGVQYLLAYDEETLFGTLSGADDSVALGERFMEKIVQYPIAVPPLLDKQLITRLDGGLESALADAGRREVNSARLSRIVDVFRSQLATPRSIDRFLAQVRHYLPMLPPDEIDDADLIILTLLRVAFPRVFRRLPSHKKELISGRTDELKRGAAGVEFEPFAVEVLLEGMDARGAADATTLLEVLFPKLKTKSGMAYGDSDKFRMANERYFDRYISMSIPAHDVSDAQVTEALQALPQGDASPLWSLLTGDQEIALLSIGKAQEVTLSSWTEDQRLELVSLLARASREMSNEPSMIFSVLERSILWISGLLGSIEAAAPSDVLSALAPAEPATRFQIVDRAIGKMEGGVPSWLQGVSESVAEEAVDLFAENLALGDEAVEEPLGYYANVAIRYGFATQLRKRVTDLLSTGETGLADLAARMVGTRTLLGTGMDRELGDIDRETWERIAPQVDDPWYGLSRLDDVDRANLSWANRKRFVQGRLAKPNTLGDPLPVEK